MMNLPEIWKKKWTASGFDQPSKIQSATFKPIFEGKDVLGIAPTGSGKTLAYLLPLLLKVIKGGGNQLIILTPSQELTNQVANVAREWGGLLELQTATLSGGANITRQIEKLKKRPEVLVGTPGRVMELVKRKKVKLMNISTILLDEVDALIQSSESNFSNQLIHHVPKRFQLVFFSATGTQVVPEVKKLSSDALIYDVTGVDDSKGEVTSFHLNLPLRKKIETLRGLSYVEGMRAIVFFNELQDLGNAEEKLIFEGVQVASLASDQNNLVRKAALEKFKKGELSYLLTTDVLSRGLDIEKLPAIINFDIPYTLDSYTHRKGRVGRMGAEGLILSFVDSSSLKNLKHYEKETDLKSEERFLWGGRLVEEIPKETQEKTKQRKKKRK
ncbi:MAG: DEAD/DEAH box helicase [Streptococcaceae bacterium]|jgi:superfamily II DNA/RNA helicase|nr:DEAD/DEAH box helicase [Streptococcaceae bacterium]